MHAAPCLISDPKGYRLRAARARRPLGPSLSVSLAHAQKIASLHEPCGTPVQGPVRLSVQVPFATGPSVVAQGMV